MYDDCGLSETFMLETCVDSQTNNCWGLKSQNGNYIQASPDDQRTFNLLKLQSTWYFK